MPITPLADGLVFDRTTFTRNLRILEARGLVSSAAAEHDARVRLVVITDEGLAVVADVLER